MFPTRTTSTTGTLRVPAAPEPAPTSFGWATTTPTLSLRVTPPPTVPDRAAPAAVPPPAEPLGPSAGYEPPARLAAPALAAPALAGSAPPRAGFPGAEPDAPGTGPVPVPSRGEPGDGAAPAVQAPRAVPLGTYASPRAAEPVADPAPHAVPVRAVPAPAGEAEPLAAEPRTARAPHAVPVPGGAATAAPAPSAGHAAPRAAEPPTARAPYRASRAADRGPAAVDAPPVVPVPGGAAKAAPVPFAGHAAPRAAEPLETAVSYGSPAATAGVEDVPAVVAAPARAAAPAEAASARAVEPEAVATPLPSAGHAAPCAAEQVPARRGATAGAADREAAPAQEPTAAAAAAGAGPGAVPAPQTPPDGGAAVPAARGESEPEPVHTTADPPSGGPDIPHPHPQHEDDDRREEPDTAPHSGVPGPGVAEIVAQAVARAMEDDDTQDLPHVCAPHRGTAVTEVPVNLPFRAAASTTPLPRREPAPAPRPARPAPGRRVPRGDDHLREHRGPVLPGWVGVAVGGLALAGCTAVLWRAGAVPDAFAAAFGAAPRAYHGLRATHWPPLAFLGIVALVALGGLGRARTGHAWVLTLFGRYRGTVRRTGLTWVSPLLLRRRVDVRLRHWRSEPMPAVDSGGLALQVVVQVVWQVKDTARATLAVADHTEYLSEQVESAMARVLSQLPADAFHEDAPTLRDAEAVGDALTRMLAAETEAVGIEVFSAQPTRIEYAAEVAEAMRRRRVAAIDAKHRDTVLTSVVDAVDDTVHRLTSRGLVELDDYERKALVKDLTVAFYTGRTE
ncbi:SPFH domain-containing protein [Streptomyces erythrochromogenes]|uniref:SPFH domain-containing protein n=1 Tax=Streptomyces erythrochromogenes TaxID=285574 RepID=UPI003867F36C|nr:SPFH domain-containing protein [Streptomyces erythrochromogenes]